MCNQALRTQQSHMNLKGGWGHTQSVQCFVNYQNDLKTHVSCGKKSVDFAWFVTNHDGFK